MNSIEAAQHYLDQQWKDSKILNLDALQRAHLRRMIGFDFQVKVQPNKLHVSSQVQPYVTTWCRNIGDMADEHQIDLLVEACLRLKIKFENEVKRLEKERKKSHK